VSGETGATPLPLQGAAGGEEIPFFVQGFVLCEKGACGHLILSINDRTTVLDFPEGSDTSFLHEAKLIVGSGSDVRVTAFISFDRDDKIPAQGHLNISTIDTDFNKSRPIQSGS
jgi:hypothetical protein